MKIYRNIFELIVSPENLFAAWDAFKQNKRNKPDVMKFEANIEKHLFQLRRELHSGTYCHAQYSGFYITDPKVRHIHKATVRDRVLHHAVFRVLNPIFEPTFVSTSFSCRVGKGTHRGVKYLTEAIRAVSQNYTKRCFVLKCDIRKFFDSIDHDTLLEIVAKRICDTRARSLLEEVIGSYFAITAFTRERERERVKEIPRKGVPIGNLTSQLFANIYLNEFDQFVKHKLRVKHYARYTDDFVIIAGSCAYLESLLPQIEHFLGRQLKLSLHPNKVSIEPCGRGTDFLGYVVLPHHIAIRIKTKQRMLRKLKERVSQYKDGMIKESAPMASLQSYLGVLSHADAHQLSENLKNQFWFWLKE